MSVGFVIPSLSDMFLYCPIYSAVVWRKKVQFGSYQFWSLRHYHLVMNLYHNLSGLSYYDDRGLTHEPEG